MTTKLYILIYILILGIVANIYSQNYYHKTYSVKDGLAQSQVYSLYQDKKGYLWIGTVGGGVNIYDGQNFKNLTIDDGLAGNLIFSIISDDAGNIWFGTDQGISMYDGKTFTNYLEEDGLPNKYVFSLFFTQEGKLLIGTGQGAAYLENDSIHLITGNDQLISTTIYSIYEDNYKNIWFGTNGKGLIRWKDQIFKVYTTEDGLCHNRIWSIKADKQQTLWIGTSDGLNILKEDSISTYRPSNSYMNSFIDDQGEIYAISYHGWLLHIKYENNSPVLKNNIGLKQYHFRSIIKDNENNIWMGSEEGLIKFPQKKFINYNETDSLHHNNVFAFCETSKGEYWVGANSKGVSRFRINPVSNRASFTNIIYKVGDPYSLAASSVFSIIEDNKGLIWFATWGGISVYDPVSDSFTNYTTDENPDIHFIYEPNLTNKVVNCVMQDSRGTIWFGTKTGVTQYIDSAYYNFNESHNILSEKEILNIYEDVKGNIWFTSKEGILQYDYNNLKYYGEKEGFTDDIANTIVQDEQGYFWIATKKGVYRFDGKEFIQINAGMGLASNNIYLLGYHKKLLYVGTNKGLDIINTKAYNDSGIIQIKHYGDIEGFIGQECNRNAFMVDKNDRLWFGTIEGITIYNPANDFQNLIPPKTYIKNLKLNFEAFNWSIFSDGTDPKTNLPLNLTLPYNKNHISFSFIATSLTIPEKVRYKYMLKGLDEEWSPALTKTEVDYPALPPGEYTFMVKAANNDGLWNTEPSVFKFSINPPFWKTTWFYIVVSLIALIIIYIYIKIREASLRKEKLILEEKVKERTAEIAQQKEIVEQKNKDITDSINYAKNIQEAILPNLEEFQQKFPSSFILYRPRDIVSGDFYWTSNRKNRTFVAASDCTGHGVPGAFMSMLGIAFLDDIITTNPTINAAELLNQLRENVMISLHQTGKEGDSQDGMDISLVIIEWDKMQLHYAGAYNPLYIIRNNELLEFKGDKMPIGFYIRQKEFKNHIIDIQQNDKLYMFSDGYADQFGGTENKKFKIKHFKELLMDINNLSMDEQKKIINETIVKWMGQGGVEQLDDILVIGIHIN